MLRLVGDCTCLDAERGVVQASKVNPVQARFAAELFGSYIRKSFFRAGTATRKS